MQIGTKIIDWRLIFRLATPVFRKYWICHYKCSLVPNRSTRAASSVFISLQPTHCLSGVIMRIFKVKITKECHVKAIQMTKKWCMSLSVTNSQQSRLPTRTRFRKNARSMFNIPETFYVLTPPRKHKLG